MNGAIDEFIAMLTEQQFGPGDLALLYFSGHGCEVGPSNVYLLATDVGDDDPNQGGLSVHMLQRRFNRMLSGVQIVFILDCCRAGYESDGGTSVTRNDFACLYACDSDQSAYERQEGGSIFTHNLIDQMLAPNDDRSTDGMFRRANKHMREQRGDNGEKQCAWMATSAQQVISLDKSVATQTHRDQIPVHMRARPPQLNS